MPIYGTLFIALTMSYNFLMIFHVGISQMNADYRIIFSYGAQVIVYSSRDQDC